MEGVPLCGWMAFDHPSSVRVDGLSHAWKVSYVVPLNHSAIASFFTLAMITESSPYIHRLSLGKSLRVTSVAFSALYTRALLWGVCCTLIYIRFCHVLPCYMGFVFWALQVMASRQTGVS